MAVIAFVPHPVRPEAISLATSTAEWLEGLGHEVKIVLDGSGDRWSCDTDALPPGLDLAVSLGGDGTMLRTVDLVCGTGVPVLGVNVGHLGYLTEVIPDELRDSLTRFLRGDYTIEERMTLEVEVTAASMEIQPLFRNCLNDVVLQRMAGGHTVRVAVGVSGEPFLTYAADSLIVATPTGSTAYNLSARGPIASPKARVILVTPVAAHMLFDRSLILAPNEEISLEVLDDHEANLLVDGYEVGRLKPGDVVKCRSGAHDARLISFGERHFHQILKRKFGLTDR
jgi:NAD+ kinase